MFNLRFTSLYAVGLYLAPVPSRKCEEHEIAADGESRFTFNLVVSRSATHSQEPMTMSVKQLLVYGYPNTLVQTTKAFLLSQDGNFDRLGKLSFR